LRDRRIHSVEDSVGARALDPRGAALRMKPAARFSKFQARPSFGSFQSS
jgi:hypothetical protein